MKRLAPVAILTLLLFAPSAQQSHATSTSIIITELLYDPVGADTGFEWIELKNISDTAVNLNGWAIQVAGTTFATKATLPDYTVAAGSIVLIGEPQVTGAAITIPSLAMQNGGSATDGVRMLDSTGIVVDTVLYDTPNANSLLDDSGTATDHTAPDCSEGQSLSRHSTLDTDDSFDDFVVSDSPTPGTDNLFPPIAIISLPDSTYIDEPVTLDASDSYDPDGSIAHYHWTIQQGETDLTTLDGLSAEYAFTDEATYHVLLSITDDSGLSAQATADISVTCDPDNPVILTIEEAKQLVSGDRVTILGVITLPRFVINDHEAYVQDATGGIRLDVGTDTSIAVGTTYEITGELSSAYGEIRISVDSAEEITSVTVVTPLATKPEDISVDDTGLLITTQFQIDQKRDRYLYGRSGSSGTPIVYIAQTISVDFPSPTKGAYLTVTGVLSRYGTHTDGTAKLRIVPRSASDIKFSIGPTAYLATTGMPMLCFYAIAAAIVFGLGTKKI